MYKCACPWLFLLLVNMLVSCVVFVCLTCLKEACLVPGAHSVMSLLGLWARNLTPDCLTLLYLKKCMPLWVKAPARYALLVSKPFSLLLVPHPASLCQCAPLSVTCRRCSPHSISATHPHLWLSGKFRGRPGGGALPSLPHSDSAHPGTDAVTMGYNPLPRWCVCVLFVGRMATLA